MLEFRFNGKTYKALYPELLRPLSYEERQDLEGSIKTRGVQVPILVDDTNGIIDGLHRCGTAEACGIAEIPVRVLAGLTEEDKRALAIEVNDCRRQQTAHELGPRRKTRAEKRAAVAAALIAQPELSDRVIAQKVKEKIGEKVDHKTVGVVRSQLGKSSEIPQSETRSCKDGRTYPAAKNAKPSQVDHASNTAPNKSDSRPKQKPSVRQKPPTPRPKPFDWIELARQLEAPKTKLTTALGSIQLFGSTGDSSMIPSRLAGIREVLSQASDLIEGVIQWHAKQPS